MKRRCETCDWWQAPPHKYIGRCERWESDTPCHHVCSSFIAKPQAAAVTPVAVSADAINTAPTYGAFILMPIPQSPSTNYQVCPMCGSSDIWQRWNQRNFAGYYCKTCGHRW